MKTNLDHQARSNHQTRYDPLTHVVTVRKGRFIFHLWIVKPPTVESSPLVARISFLSLAACLLIKSRPLRLDVGRYAELANLCNSR